MKRIRRPKVALPTLLPGGSGGNEATQRETLFKTSRKVEDVITKFQDYWGNADVRGALWAMQGRSCAYCDRELPGNDRGDVEHFRPKNIYWWLAYKFENYLLSCSVCNSAYKGNNFPILPHRKPYDYSMKDELDKERRALIDPVSDVTDGWFGIQFTDEWKTKGFQLTINPRLRRIETQRCETTRAFFKLNIDSELLKARQIAVHGAMKLVAKAMAGDEDSKSELRKMAVRFSPHSFAVREVIVSYANRPEYLPSYEQEVEWLVEELSSVLRFALNALEQEAKNTTERDRRDRCAWALAVLMKDPPALSTDVIRTQLEAGKVLEIVEPFYKLISA